MAEIKEIKALPKIEKKLRVAGYCRVSSGKDEQLHSLSVQVNYFKERIVQHPGWEFAGVFYDEAKTGTKESRSGFQDLLIACRSGKVDMVITKSISRFARNTVMLLETVRELKTLGTDVFFEEQNIHTKSSDGELMLTILASYAQEESLSASENQKWRIKKNFEAGIPWNGAMLGYRIENGIFKIVPEEAVIVKRIFELYLSGKGVQSIANTLNKDGIKTRFGSKFHYDGIYKILRNEKYAGNLLLQKTFRENYITKRKVINKGELPMYYVEDAHEPIISPESFQKVQEIIAKKAEKYASQKAKTHVNYPFTSLITCENCRKHFRRKTVKGKPVWICPTFNYEGKAACAAKQIPEDILTGITDKMEMEQITGITARDGNRLLFHFADGTTIEKTWKDHSRSESWTDEMKEAARQRALAQKGVSKCRK